MDPGSQIQEHCQRKQSNLTTTARRDFPRLPTADEGSDAAARWPSRPPLVENPVAAPMMLHVWRSDGCTLIHETCSHTPCQQGEAMLRRLFAMLAIAKAFVAFAQAPSSVEISGAISGERPSDVTLTLTSSQGTGTAVHQGADEGTRFRTSPRARTSSARLWEAIR